MPLTRSQGLPSDGDQESTSGMSQAEVEILYKRITDKEEVLREQAEALRHKQEELERLRLDMEQGQETNGATNVKNRMDLLEQKLDMLTALPGQLNSLNQRVADIQTRPAWRDTPSRLISESVKGNEGQERSPIRLKDVIDSIPKYDGHKMSVFHFCKMCERALTLIPQYHEYHLVQLIINKLYGHAYAAIEGTEYGTVFDLTRRLRKIFGPNKSTDQYRGELANIYMKPNENILDYVERVKELRTSILDGETTESGFIDGTLKDSIEASARDSFVNGLPSDLLIRVKLERYYTLEDAIISAIQLSKTLEAENLRKRGTVYKPNPSFRADVTYNTRTPNAPRLLSEPSTNVPRNTPIIKPLVPGQPGPNYPEKICYYCKAPGHFIRDCQKLIYKNKDERSPRTYVVDNQRNAGNASSVPGTSVHRDANQTGRTSTNVMILQEPVNLPLLASPN